MSVASEILRDELCLEVPQPSRSAEIVRTEIILTAITFPIIALRLISRVWVARKVWWDDWMVVAAAVSETQAPVMNLAVNGGGRS